MRLSKAQIAVLGLMGPGIDILLPDPFPRPKMPSPLLPSPRPEGAATEEQKNATLKGRRGKGTRRQRKNRKSAQ